MGARGPTLRDMWQRTAGRAALLARDVVTRAELVAVGVDDGAAALACRRGTWQQVLVGTYLLGPGPVTGRHREQAGLLLGGPGAMLTAVSACSHHGLRDLPEGDDVWVLVPHARRRRPPPGLRLLRTLEVLDPVQLDGLTCAPLDRAVLDAARACSGLRATRALLAAAVCDRRVDPALLRAQLDLGPVGGSAFVRRALRDLLDGARSAPEAELADVLRPALARRRLPAPLLNPRIEVDGRLVGLPDLWVPGLGLGIEVDSRRHHAGDAEFDATLARHDGFVRHGLALLHVTPRRLRQDPAGYAALVADVAAARRRLAQPEPAGLRCLPCR